MRITVKRDGIALGEYRFPMGTEPCGDMAAAVCGRSGDERRAIREAFAYLKNVPCAVAVNLRWGLTVERAAAPE